MKIPVDVLAFGYGPTPVFHRDSHDRRRQLPSGVIRTRTRKPVPALGTHHGRSGELRNIFHGQGRSHMSFLGKLHQVEAEMAAATLPTHGRCAWNECAAKLVTTASSALALRRCSTTWRSSNAVEERVQAVGWRRLCAS